MDKNKGDRKFGGERADFQGPTEVPFCLSFFPYGMYKYGGSDQVSFQLQVQLMTHLHRRPTS